MADQEVIKIDDYELTTCISTGSATQIWEVEKGGGPTLAMKLLLPEAFKDNELKASLKHEANVAQSLSHPNIIRVVESKFSRKHGYLIMELFRGGNLKNQIRTDKATVQSQAKRIIECLAQALGHMHEKKWIHKDVKPDNVMVTKGGEVRLIDFSLSGRAGSSVTHMLKKKRNIVIQGTRTYLAPEMIRREVVTHSVDIYSLGVLLYEMLVGHPPFRHGNPNELLIMHVRDSATPPSMIDKNITADVDKFIARLMSKQPKDRPATMQEVYSEVRNLNFFHEDPLQYAKKESERVKNSDAQAQNDRLNSRVDAERTALGIVMPARPAKPKPNLSAADLAEKPSAKTGAKPAPAQTPAAAPAGMFPPGMAPQGYPQGFAPGFAPPGYPPGFGQPGMMPPGAMPPGMMPPGMMPQGMPGQGFPQGFGPPGLPPQGMPQGMPSGMPPGFGPPGFGQPGFGQPGVPPAGFPQPGMPPGASPQGFPQAGFPQVGAPPQGIPGQIPVPGQQNRIPQVPNPVPAPNPVAAKPAPKPVDDTPLASIDDFDIE